MSQTKITTDNINTLDASMLTGSALPALNGAALTNVPGVTNSASDPLISTNPSGGVGSAWLNTTTGNLFCCTDATAGANVWINVGSGSGDVEPYRFQGTVAGYTATGSRLNQAPVATIDKHSFTSDGNSTLISGVTQQGRHGAAGGKSKTHGYTMGGLAPSASTIIEKFSYAAETDCTDVGDINVARGYMSGQSSGTNVYCSGGENGPAVNTVEKRATASDGNATDVLDITVSRSNLSGASSSTHGFNAGGGGGTTTVDKFSFSNDNNAVDHGDLFGGLGDTGGGQSSTTHGYAAGATSSNSIYQYAFASNVTGTDHGDLTATRGMSGGTSSTTHGYVTGGAPSGAVNIIEKFTFASSGNATDVGDLAQAFHTPACSQV